MRSTDSKVVEARPGDQNRCEKGSSDRTGIGGDGGPARRRRLCLAIVLLAATVVAPSTLQAITTSWTGAIDNKWSTGGNWSGGVPGAGDTLVFPSGAANLTNVNDLPGGTVYGTLVFTGNGYQVSGNAIGLTGGISSAPGPTINIGLKLYATQTFGQTYGDQAVIGGGIDLNGYDLTLGSTSVVGVVAGSGNVVLQYGVLLGNNTYTGTTTINSGNGQIHGQQAQSDVLASQPLVASGTLGNVSASGGVFPRKPDGSAAVLTTKNLSLMGGAFLSVTVAGGSPGVGYGQLSALGTVSLSGAPQLALSFSASFIPSLGQQFVLIDNDGADPISGTFNGMSEGAVITALGYQYQLSYLGGTGNDVVLTSLNGRTASTTTLASSQNPSTPGQSVTLTATVTGSSGTPTGSVTFKDGSTVLGSINLSGNTAQYATSSLTLGTHSITATYNGDSIYGSSTSTAVNQVVSTGADMALTNTAPASVVAGSPIAYTITLTNNGPLAAGGIIWSATLPANTGFVSLAIPAPQSDWSCSTPGVGAAGLVSCSYLPVGLPASTSKVFTLTASTFCGIPYTTLSTTANVITGSTVDPNPSNNSQLATTTVTSGVVFAGASSASSQGTCTIKTTWNAATAGPCTKTSRISYNVYRSTSAVFTPSAGNRVASCVTGNGSTISYQDNSGLTSGTTYYYIVRAEDQLTPGTGPCGGTEDGNTVTVSTTAPVTCSGSNPNPIQVTTVTSTSGQNVIEWLNPSSGPYGGIGTTVRYSTTSFPETPIDGLNVGSVVGSLGGKSKLTHTGLSNATTHYYSLFVDGGAGVFSSGRSVDGRPFATPAQVFWSFSTAGSALNPVQTSPGSTGAVYGPSNDRYVHAMKRGGAGGGPWPTGGPWKPYALNAPSADRVLVVDTTLVASSTRVVYAASQDGQLTCIDGPTGAMRWSSLIANPGENLTGAPAKMLVNAGAAYNLIFVGTRNPSANTGSRLVGVDAGTGIPKVIYAGLASDLGMISSEVAVNPTSNRVYFTSRAGVSGRTVSCVQISGPLGSPSAAPCGGFTSPAVGDVDAPPTLFLNTLYVGSNDGKVHAIDATTGAIIWSVDPADGAVRGRIYRDNATNRIWFATATKVWSYLDSGSSGVFYQFSAPIAGGSSPILYNTKVYVGSSDGAIHEMDAVTGANQKSVVLGNGTAQVGAPSIDSTNAVVYAGTEDGKTYSVVVPF